MATVDDGTGNGFKAEVNSEHQLETASVDTSITLHRVEEGTGFNINTSTLSTTINFTDAVEDTAVLYVKNDDVNDMVITSALISTGQSTGAADNGITVKQVGNFTSASDIIANGTAGIAVNRNSGKSSRSFDGTVTTGGTGRSFTSAVAGQQVMGDFTTPVRIDLTTIIPVGGEFGVTVDPPALNTAMDFMVSINFHIAENGS